MTPHTASCHSEAPAPAAGGGSTGPHRLSNSIYVTDVGLRAVSSCNALTSLNLTCCYELTDEALRAVSSLPALASLSLTCCIKLTDEALRAVIK
jgi:hypothetical protein